MMCDLVGGNMSLGACLVSLQIHAIHSQLPMLPVYGSRSEPSASCSNCMTPLGLLFSYFFGNTIPNKSLHICYLIWKLYHNNRKVTNTANILKRDY